MCLLFAAALRRAAHGCAGAVWDIWAVEDVDPLRAYLESHVHEFKHKQRQLSSEMVGGVMRCRGPVASWGSLPLPMLLLLL